MTYVAIVLAVVESRIFLIRRRSRIDMTQDLGTGKLCSDIVSGQSNMTRAESDGVIVMLESPRRPTSENAV